MRNVFEIALRRFQQHAKSRLPLPPMLDAEPGAALPAVESDLGDRSRLLACLKGEARQICPDSVRRTAGEGSEVMLPEPVLSKKAAIQLGRVLDQQDNEFAGQEPIWQLAHADAWKVV